MNDMLIIAAAITALCLVVFLVTYARSVLRKHAEQSTFWAELEDEEHSHWRQERAKWAASSTAQRVRAYAHEVALRDGLVGDQLLRYWEAVYNTCAAVESGGLSLAAAYNECHGHSSRVRFVLRRPAVLTSLRSVPARVAVQDEIHDTKAG